MSEIILKPATIWITGLAASGKTTLGQKLFGDIKRKGINNIDFFDGEDVRHKLGEIYGYVNEDRNTLNLYKAELALRSNKKGNIAIITSVSHKKDIRKIIRARIANFMEVYLNCPASVCAQRDYKGHYKKAFAGEYENFVGVTEPYEESDKVELILDTASYSIEESSQVLLETSLKFIYEPSREEVLE